MDLKDKMNKKTITGITAALIMLLSGCSGNVPDTVQTSQTSAETTGITENTAEQATGTTVDERPVDKSDAIDIKFRFADEQEGEQCLLAQKGYLEGLTRNDLDYRVGRKGADLDEFRQLLKENVLSFTDEEKKLLTMYVEKMEDRMNEMGFPYKVPEEIIFVKTTMAEEGDAAAYTHGTEIYLGQDPMDYCTGVGTYDQDFAELVAHEFFHCMTRGNENFRCDMYSVIGTTIDSSIEIDPAMRANILSNPDVERYDNYAVFDIDGTPTECMIVTYVEDYEEGYESFFDHIRPALLPVRTQDRFYFADDVPDFFNVVGRNTGYVIAAEECMADNFAYAMVYGSRDRDGNEYPSQDIIDSILEKCSGK